MFRDDNVIWHELSENQTFGKTLASGVRADGVLVERFVVDGVVVLSSTIVVDDVVMQSITN